MAKLDQITVGGTLYELAPEIAPLFDNTKAYAIGDCVIKDAVLYRFTVAHAAGTWIGTDAEEVTVGEELTDLKADLSATDSALNDGYIRTNHGTFVSGVLDGNGNPVSSATRLRSEKAVNYGANTISIFFPTGYRINKQIFSAETVAHADFVSRDTSWTTDSPYVFTADPNYYYAFNLSKSDDSNIAVSEAGNYSYYVKTKLAGLFDDNKILEITDGLDSTMFKHGTLESDGRTISAYRAYNRIATKTVFYAPNDLCIYTKLSNQNARAYAFFFDNEKNLVNTASWGLSIYIPKNTLFTLMMSSAYNADSQTEISVDTILSNFYVVNYDKIISNTFDKRYNRYQVGLISSTNNQLYNSAKSVAILDYFKTDGAFIKIETENDFAVSIIGYDENFNIVHPRTDYGDKTGTNYIDVSDVVYVRFNIVVPSGYDETIANAIANVTITRNYPINIQTGSENVLSISKDGINDDGASYAPSYPKSSLVSFQKAFDQGFRALMLHVQFTSDDVPVVFHDEKINRWAVNADGTTISTNVFIASSTLQELNAYDFGKKFGDQYAGTKITLFSEALDFCKKRGVKACIEPPTTLSTARNTIVCDMIKAIGMQENCAYFAYKLAVLQQVHSELEYADLLWAPSDGESYFMDHLNDYIALKGQNDIYLYAGINYTSENRQTIISTGKVRFISAPDTGAEPDSFLTRMQANPFISGMVSQVVPAYSALQKLT